MRKKRTVRLVARSLHFGVLTINANLLRLEKSTIYQRKTRCEGREGAIRKDGREDAQEARGAVKEEREKE